jgi:hypothetical protein
MSLLQLQEALAPSSEAELWESVFLQTGTELPATLDCECEKIKCNCVKACACSMHAMPAGAGGSGPLLTGRAPAAAQRLTVHASALDSDGE